MYYDDPNAPDTDEDYQDIQQNNQFLLDNLNQQDQTVNRLNKNPL